MSTFRAAQIYPDGATRNHAAGAIVATNGRIESLGVFRSSEDHGDTIDLGDVAVFPGLIDPHVHLTMPADGRSYDEIHSQGDESLALTATRSMIDHLRAGFTTVRDNGARNSVIFAVKEAQRRNRVLGPRVLAAGRPLTPTAGHFNFCGGVADSPDEIRAEIRRLAAEGADHIKVMASGGGSRGSHPVDITYTQAQLRCAVEASHELGLKVAAHCRASAGMRMSALAGVDSIEHADFLETVAGYDGARLTGGTRRTQMRYDEELAELLWERGVYLSFTLQAGGYERLMELESASWELTDGELAERKSLRRYFADKLEILRRLRRDGFGDRLALSSDAGPGGTQFGRFDLWLELAREADMSPEAVMAACTGVAARLCGIADEIGALKRGYLADFIAVRLDASGVPLMTDVVAVVVGGNVVMTSDVDIARQSRCTAPQQSVHLVP